MNPTTTASQATLSRPATLPFNAAGVPEALRFPQWVPWRWEKRGQEDGEWTKPPYDHRTGCHAEWKDPAVYLTFAAAQALLPQYDGIGLVLTEQNGLTGIDLDHCVEPETGAIAPWAMAVVDRLNSYTERTVSGRGLRIWIRGRLPAGRRRTTRIELYDSLRFFTVTGCRLEGAPPAVEARQAELDAYHAELFPPKPQGRARPVDPITEDDQVLLEKARTAKNGARFRRLFDEGDTSAHENDESKADFALCGHLLFWCRGDAAQVDRLFRQSRLFRPKWDSRRGESTYGHLTIANALAGSHEFYSGSFSGTSNGNGKSSHHAGANPPPPVPNAEGAPSGTPESPRHTDLGNARRLAHQHGGALRFTLAHGWLYWDGCRWRRDGTGEAKRRAKETVGAMFAEAATLADDRRKELGNWALKSESAARIRDMLELAQSEHPIAADAALFDSDPWLLNCRNKTIDLKTGRPLDHDPRHLITKLVPVDYDAGAACPTWHAYLRAVTDDNEELIEFLWRAIGYSLTGDVSEQVLFFLHGMGANGKTTLLNVLLALLGDYATQAAPGLLLDRRGERHPTELADLAGKRLVASVEVGEGKKLAEELVKQMTGGDRMKARFMRRDFFDFPPTHKLWLAANHKPVIKGTDHAIWRRIPLVPFNATFSDTPADSRFKKDPQLLPKLLAELPGILAWAVQGCLEWRRRGLRPPAVVEKATAAYREEMDVLGDFLGDCCVLGPLTNHWAKSSDLYSTYKRWCESTGEAPVKQKTFGQRLQERGCQPDRHYLHGRIWRGIGLQSGHDTFSDMTHHDAESGIDTKENAHEALIPKNVSERVMSPNVSCPAPAGADGEVEL